MTGRIPYLLNLFDHILQLAMGTEGGVNVGQEQYNLSAAKYEKKLPAHIEQLTTGPDAIRLEIREQELLLMTVFAARSANFESPSIFNYIQEYWDERLFEDEWKKEKPGQPYPAAYTGTTEDRLAARVVADLGLLPHPIDQTNPRGEAFIERDDPLVRVIAPALLRL